MNISSRCKPHGRIQRMMTLLCLSTLLAGFPLFHRAFSAGRQATLLDNQKAKEAGCNVSGILPHYTLVSRSGTPDPSKGFYGYAAYTHVADSDLPTDHDWHDFNAYLYLDEDAYPNNSDTNFEATANYLVPLAFPFWRPNQTKVMEVEWDSTYLPQRFWPVAGDRLWMKGHFIWDCGHPDGYHNEIHPPKAIAFTRSEPSSLINNGELDYTNLTTVYIHGRGGYPRVDIPGVGSYESSDSPVATENYEFYAPLPDAKFVTGNASPSYRLVELPYGGPTPQVSLEEYPAKSGKWRAKIKYALSLGDPNPDRKFAAVIATGWRIDQTHDVTIRKFTIKLDKIRVHDSHSTFCRTDWNLWVVVNGHWLKVRDTNALAHSDETRLINRSLSVALAETPGGPAKLVVQTTGWVSAFDGAFGIRNDPVGAVARTVPKLGTLNVLNTTEGKIGMIHDVYASPTFGRGGHESSSSRFEEIDRTLGPAETTGDYILTYSILE